VNRCLAAVLAVLMPSRGRRPGVNTEGQITIRQWFRLPKYERAERIAEFKNADNELQAYFPPGRDEDEAYLRLNGRVNDLWPTVPWWWRR
jgi:hypothetical protein